MWFYSLIFFILSQIFILTHGSLWWLAIILIFACFVSNKIISTKFKKFPTIGLFVIFLLFNFLFYRIFNIEVIWQEIHIIILSGLFWFFIQSLKNISKGSKKKEIRWQFLSFVSTTFLSVWFFYSNIHENFFWKELILFLGIFLIFWAEREILFVMNNMRYRKTAILDFALPIILVEFAWVISFLPINFLSLAGIWLAGFYLCREFAVSYWENKFHWKTFLPKTILIVIFVIIIMASANWKII